MVKAENRKNLGKYKLKRVSIQPGNIKKLKYHTKTVHNYIISNTINKHNIKNSTIQTVIMGQGENTMRTTNQQRDGFKKASKLEASTYKASAISNYFSYWNNKKSIYYAYKKHGLQRAQQHQI
jgi:hypothetical protein